MKNKILILVAAITMILTNLCVVFAEDNSPQNDFSWRYEPTENLTAGDDITVFADGLEVSHTLILALYKDDVLVDLAVNKEKSATVTLPNDFSEENEWTVKAFVWDSFSSMIPLGDSLDVKLETDIDVDITDKFTDTNFLNTMRAIIGKSEGETIYKSDVENITALDINGKDIENLDGVEYFTSLEKLECWDNELTSLDVSKNIHLKELYCYANYFQTLDLSNNIELEILDCSYNMDLTSLNVSKNTELKILECNYAVLGALDVSNNVNLTRLICFYNQLEELDVSNNRALTYLDCNKNHLTELDITNNTELTHLNCVQNFMKSVDDVKGWQENGLILSQSFKFNSQRGDITYRFTDNNFLQEVRAITGKREGEVIYKSDVENITELNLADKNIESLTGIEYFTALEKLDCSENELTELDVSKNTRLKELDCKVNYLQTLELSNNTELEILDCFLNIELTSLDTSNNAALKELDCSYTALDFLDIANNINIIKLDCESTKIMQLDMSNNLKLRKLDCSRNRLMTTLDISNNGELTHLTCKTNKLTSLDISENKKLTYLDCGYNKIETIDVSNNKELKRFYCNGNKLTGLDISENKNLERLSCTDNQMSSVDDVKGWENMGLILGDTFKFDPQKN